MSHRLTVRVTADSLEGALNRARGEAERYFGGHPFEFVGTTSSTAFGHSYFITEVTFETESAEQDDLDERCGLVDRASGAICILPRGHKEVHCARSGRVFPSGVSRCGAVSRSADHACDLPEGHTGRHADSDTGASWVA